MKYTEITSAKIMLRNAGWKWSRKLRRWEKGELVAQSMEHAMIMQMDEDKFQAE